MASKTDTNTVEDGYELQLGDIVHVDTRLNKHRHKITRVTKKYAFSFVSEHYEAKFPRVYKRLGFSSVPRQMWDTCLYNVERAAK